MQICKQGPNIKKKHWVLVKDLISSYKGPQTQKAKLIKKRMEWLYQFSRGNVFLNQRVTSFDFDKLLRKNFNEKSLLAMKIKGLTFLKRNLK